MPNKLKIIVEFILKDDKFLKVPNNVFLPTRLKRQKNMTNSIFSCQTTLKKASGIWH